MLDKVWLPAIAGYLPSQMVRAISSFLDFCYLVRRDIIDQTTLDAIEDALARFHNDRVIFEEAGVRPEGFSLPRQHSLKHYVELIREFGAPNGLCSSITESKHIEAVKKPWRRSNHYNALGQMLKTISRVDKLRASRASFKARGIFNENSFLSKMFPEEKKVEDNADEDDAAVEGPSVKGYTALAITPRKMNLECSIISLIYVCQRRTTHPV